jgi:hypothetical protein
LTSIDADSADSLDAAVWDADAPERVVDVLYSLISGPAGEAPRWDRFRALFAPGARLMPTNREADGGRVMRVHDVEDYIQAYGAHLREHGFYEMQVAHRVERFGRIAHVWSTYTSHVSPEAEAFARGINSIQLYHDGRRWWVVTIFWDSERDDNPIPPQYLSSST